MSSIRLSRGSSSFAGSYGDSGRAEAVGHHLLLYDLLTLNADRARSLHQGDRGPIKTGYIAGWIRVNV